MKHLLSANLFVFLLMGISLSSQAQNYVLADSINIIENGKTLTSPYAGGINIPRYSPIDLNGDQVDDLFLFDRDGNLSRTFLNGGTTNQVDYYHAPKYESGFPDMRDWALLRDFNCDGKPDIFTYNNDGIRVYRNTSIGNTVSFQLEVNKVQTDNGATLGDIFITSGDLPAIIDVDGDGDLDILTFDAAGSFVEWHSNQGIELNNCDTLVFLLADACWGKFQESGLSNQISLNLSCKGGPGFAGASSNSGIHSGSTLAAFDENSDGDLELLVGDLLSNKLVYLHNAGTPTAALIDSFEYNFPSYDTSVDFELFPSAFFLDVNNDGKEDLISAPNPENVSINYESNWFYKNIGTSSLTEFSLTSKSFLQDQMIDVGSGAYPIFFDHNADGLLDLLVGNVSFKTISKNYSSLSLYENTGTANDPKFTLITRDYQNLSTSFSPQIFATYPSFGDLDGDGDQDMLIGDSDGRVHLFTNSAGTGNQAIFSLTGFKYQAIDVGQFATPSIVDLDNDGLLDLVIGEMGGTLNFFKNTGTTISPTFSSSPTSDTLGGIDVSPFCCTGFSTPFFYEDLISGLHIMVGEENGNILHYGGINGNVYGHWTLLDSNFQDLGEGTRTAITGADLDGDGKMEYAMGNIRGGIQLFTEKKSAGTDLSIPLLNWEVFPNPGSNPRLRYDLAGSQLKVEWLNLTGKILGEQSLPEGQHVIELNLHRIQAGIYFLRLTNGEGAISTRKWIKM